MGTDEFLGLLEDVTEEGIGIETAEEYGRPEMVWRHLRPEVMSVPGRDQILNTGDCFHRVCFGVFGRDLETHGLDQVVIECDE